MLSNATAIAKTWFPCLRKLDFMYSNRTFLPWYVSEDTEEAGFSESRPNLVRISGGCLCSGCRGAVEEVEVATDFAPSSHAAVDRESSKSS